MNTFRIFLTLIVLGTFCFCSAQEPPKQNLVKMMRSDVVRIQFKILGKSLLHASWNGIDLHRLSSQLLSNPEVRKNWEVSDEQYEKIKNLQKEFPTMFSKQPDFVAFQDEKKKMQKPDDPLFQNADEKTKQKLVEILEQCRIAANKFQSQEFEKLLTPKQKRKMREFQLATMSETSFSEPPMVSVTMFEALDLSEEQKKKMTEIKKELEPDFEHTANEFTNDCIAFVDKLLDRFEKEHPVITDEEELNEKLRAMTGPIEHDKDFQKLLQELNQKRQHFITRVKFKIFDVLTDEQMEKLQNLIDHQPDYVKTIIAEAKRLRGENTNPLQMHLNSWQPGEPIPEEYKKHRAAKKAFPSEEK